jgi:hypothetical protein
MKIKFYKTLTKSTLEDIDRLAFLMQGIGETNWVTLGTAVYLLGNKVGCLFVVYKGSQKVAYGIFSYGMNNPQFKRLYYFAVETDFKGRGIGKKSILGAIQREVDLASGCIVTCKLNLRSYYEKLGFKYSCDVDDKSIKQVVLILSNRSLDLIGQEEKVTNMAVVDSTFLYSHLPNIEKEYGIKLLRNSIDKPKIIFSGA